MPCITQTDITPDKKEYLSSQLNAVKHVIDYYYRTQSSRVPDAKHNGRATHQELAHESFYCDLDYTIINEQQIFESIAHHCSCDGVWFGELYDLIQLLDLGDGSECGYARVIMTCANMMRADKDIFDYRR